MTVELAAIIITGVISLGDLVVNVWTGCLKGTCRVRIGGNEIEHKDTEADLVEVIKDQGRRMSCPH